MKTAFVIFALAGLLGVTVQARTWTSADGSKTFEGTLKSFDPASGMVTVIVDGRPLAFPQDKLSEGDRDFLKESQPTVAETPVSSATEATSVVGAIVAKAKLQKLDGKRFKKAESIKSPDYYVLYYSASW